MAIKPFELSNKSYVFSNLPKATDSDTPLTFEDLKQDYGYMLYRTKIEGGKKGLLKINKLRDYALIFINGKRAGVLDRRLNQDSILLDLPKGNLQLDIFVENMGRINFGKYLLDNKKGITESVLFNGAELKKWSMFSLPFNRAAEISAKKAVIQVKEGPIIRSGSFNLTKTADTYLDMRKWGKGVVWVNGHNLGKYWSIGPQQTIYLPKEWLKTGKNEISVLELLDDKQNTIQAISAPILNELKK